MRCLLSVFALVLCCSAVFADDKPADTKAVSFPSTGDAAVTLTVPTAAKITSDNGKLTIDMAKLNVYLWLAPQGKTIDDAVAGIGDIIKGEVVNLKTEETKTIKVAGSDAKELRGTSNEADDNDDGTFDVVVFSVGGKVIVACEHGEKEFAPKHRKAFHHILKTAKAP